MKFNHVEYYQSHGDSAKFKNRILAISDEIYIHYNDESLKLPGGKQIKKGHYKVIDINKGLNSTTEIYQILKKGSKYSFFINAIAIDKAILANVISIINDKCG